MKKMKKALAVLAALTMMVGMVSCGGNSGSGDTTTAAAGSSASSSSGDVDISGVNLTEATAKNFKIKVADGWKLMSASDIGSMMEAADFLVKGDKWDATAPYIQVGTTTGNITDWAEQTKKDSYVKYDGEYTINGIKWYVADKIAGAEIGGKIVTVTPQNGVDLKDKAVQAMMGNISWASGDAAAETTAAAEASTTTAAAAQIPANSHELTVNNNVLGFTAKIAMPQVDGSQLKELLNKEDDNYQAYKEWYIEGKDGEQIYSFELTVNPVDSLALKSSEKNDKETKKDYGNGLSCFTMTTDTNGRKSCTANCFKEGYLDGCIRVHLRVEGSNGKGTEEELLAYVEKALPTLTLTGDLTNTKTADGNLRMMLHEKDVSIPQKIKIAGNDCTVTQRVGGANLVWDTTFQTTESKFKIGTSAKARKKSFENSKDPETTIAGMPAKFSVEAKSDGTLQSVLYLLINDEDCLNIYCRTTGFIDGELLDAAKKKEKVQEMVNDANIAKTREMFEGFYNDFVGAMKIECAGAVSAAVTTAAQTAAAAATTTTTTTAAVGAAEDKKLTDNNAASQGMSTDVLLTQAKMFHASAYNHMPEFAEITETNGNEVTVKLYDMRANGEKVLNEVIVDPTTGTGKEKNTGRTFQITSNQPMNEPLWEPDNEVFSLVPAGKDAAVIYVGSQKKAEEIVDPETPMKYFVENSALAKKHPFLSEIPEQNVVYTDKGSELWVIIPKSAASTITVWERDPATNTAKYRLTETYNGSPIILSCNYSDIGSDVSVQIKYIGGKTCAPFSPYISMKDGEPTTTDETNVSVIK